MVLPPGATEKVGEVKVYSALVPEAARHACRSRWRCRRCPTVKVRVALLAAGDGAEVERERAHVGHRRWAAAVPVPVTARLTVGALAALLVMARQPVSVSTSVSRKVTVRVVEAPGGP